MCMTEPTGTDDSEPDLTPLMRLLTTTDEDDVPVVVSGVLELLTIRATAQGAYYLQTDDEDAVVVIAANDDAKELLALLPERFAPGVPAEYEGDEEGCQ